MSVEDGFTGSWDKPKKPEARNIVVNADQFWHRINEEVIDWSVDHDAFQQTLINIGLPIVTYSGGEKMVLRDDCGDEEEINLMDDRFKPQKPSFHIGAKPREMVIVFSEKSWGPAKDYADRNCIDLEELGGRAINAGLHMAHETRGGKKRIVEYRRDATVDRSFTMAQKITRERIAEYLKTLEPKS